MHWHWLPEDRAERIGLIVSLAGHGALIVWALLGGLFFTPQDNPATLSTEVSLMSSEEFAALQARAPTAKTESEAQPSAPQSSPTPPPAPTAIEQPEAAPEVETASTDETVATDAPPAETDTPTPDSLSQIPQAAEPDPQPKAAEIVSPDASTDRPPDAETAADTQEATADTPAPEAKPREEQTETAPRDTGEVLLTEENRDLEMATAAPARSPRPPQRPERSALATPEVTEPTEPDAETPPIEAAPTSQDPVADALAEALSGAASDVPEAGTGVQDTGPPLTDGESDALVVAVKQCWNVGSLSTDALRTVVTVGVSMQPDGRPDSGSIRMIGFEGGDEAAARQAFEAGRRAIIRCAGSGYPLPAEKYEQWKEIEIVFNPEKMRLR